MGTYLGGWRIIRTMGSGLTELRPPQGFAAQTSAATVILASSHLGFSLSTTQSCSGAVMGAGLGRKGGTVRWSTATRMFVAWGLTLPAAGLVGAGAEFLTKQGPWGVTVVAVLLIAGSGAIWMLSRRKPVDHTNVTVGAEPRASSPPPSRRSARRPPVPRYRTSRPPSRPPRPVPRPTRPRCKDTTA